ncbi:hypothetical protein C8E03_108171 [Lachnotalea glycerini]|uniref:Uncharacterized protein n=1 Tax=Lachnotalea glycerini TaxID=1763509 RepID=A0A318EUJ0_9FIRM|nr:hypothetical protein C8E03_108171 [Lachnotalea glycerini]
MTNKKCFEKHFHARQGICLAERYQNKLFSVAV